MSEGQASGCAFTCAMASSNCSLKCQGISLYTAYTSFNLNAHCWTCYYVLHATHSPTLIGVSSRHWGCRLASSTAKQHCEIAQIGRRLQNMQAMVFLLQRSYHLWTYLTMVPSAPFELPPKPSIPDPCSITSLALTLRQAGHRPSNAALCYSISRLVHY